MPMSPENQIDLQFRVLVEERCGYSEGDEFLRVKKEMLWEAIQRTNFEINSLAKARAIMKQIKSEDEEMGRFILSQLLEGWTPERLFPTDKELIEQIAFLREQSKL